MMKLPQGFDLHSIHVFRLTAELGGMTQSAQALGMTQSAVSQTISKLEGALDTKLFDRAMRPVALTPAGRLLLQDGSRLLGTARALAQEVREGSQRPFDCVTIAMAESIANHLTAPLLLGIGARARTWQLRSGISLMQHHDFVSRKIDMLVTGSSQLEDAEGIDHLPIMTEAFVLVAPASVPPSIDDFATVAHLPFIRYSLLSAMGQRIERQIARLKLSLPNSVEMDSTMQQLTAVAAGAGWSITTPLCLASHLDLLDALTIAPMPRAPFRRSVQLVARRGEFGTLPREIVALAVAELRAAKLATLVQRLPWIDQALGWPDA